MCSAESGHVGVIWAYLFELSQAFDIIIKLYSQRTQIKAAEQVNNHILFCFD